MEMGIVVAVLGLAGTVVAALLQRRTKQDEMTESRIVEILNRQDGTIEDLQDDVKELKSENSSLRVDVDELKSENRRVWGMFNSAMFTLRNFIDFSHGKLSSEPVVPVEIRPHLPE